MGDLTVSGDAYTFADHDATTPPNRMTLLVGIRCDDGTVLAADSRATRVDANGQRIGSTMTASKVYELAAGVLWAFHGDADIARSSLRPHLEKELTGQNLRGARETLGAAIAREYVGRRDAQGATWGTHDVVRPNGDRVEGAVLSGPPVEQVTSVFASADCLIEVPSTGRVSEASASAPWVVVGNLEDTPVVVGALKRCLGDLSARHFDVTAGVRLAYHVMRIAIDASEERGGRVQLGDPVQLWTVDTNGAKQVQAETVEACGAEYVDTLASWIASTGQQGNVANRPWRKRR